MRRSSEETRGRRVEGVWRVGVGGVRWVEGLGQKNEQGMKERERE